MCEPIALKDVVTIGVSGLALTISYFNYKRDSANLSLSVSVGNVAPINNLDAQSAALYINAINIGRRPLIIKGIGFYCSNWFIRMLGRAFPDKIKPKGAWWTPDGPKSALHAFLYETELSSSKPRKLNEGEAVSAVIPIDKSDHKLALLKLFTDAKRMYIEDMTGRLYFLPCRQLRKIRADLLHPRKTENQKV